MLSLYPRGLNGRASIVCQSNSGPYLTEKCVLSKKTLCIVFYAQNHEKCHSGRLEFTTMILVLVCFISFLHCGFANGKHAVFVFV